MRSNGMSSAFDTRSQMSCDSGAVCSLVMVPTFLTATSAAGAVVPPKVIGNPGTRHVITQRSGFRNATDASLESSASSGFAPSAGAAADVKTWTRGIRSDRVHVGDQVGDLAGRQPRRVAVVVAAVDRV